jgi:predicted lipoprotein with Yx(FWY)xxD motif
MAAHTKDEIAAQVAATIVVRAAAARVHAPEHLRQAIAPQRRAAARKPRQEVIVKRLLILGALAASLALAACGGGTGGGSSQPATPATATTTVAVKSIGGIGSVLVDSGGKALYSSDVEADGKVLCTGACTSFWKPLTQQSGTPTAPTGAGKLGVVRRPDGARQVTADGKLLYTFSEDAPGKVEGNGFSDDFDGRHFTWNAVLAGGKAAGAAGASSRGGYGY